MTPPPGLEAKIRKSIGSTQSQNSPSWRAMAASIAVAAVVSSSATWMLARPSPADTVTEAVVAAHLRGLMAAQPTDVASSDRHTVKPWFDGKIPQAPRVVDLSQEGFRLVGGRVDVVG